MFCTITAPRATAIVVVGKPQGHYKNDKIGYPKEGVLISESTLRYPGGEDVCELSLRYNASHNPRPDSNPLRGRPPERYDRQDRERRYVHSVGDHLYLGISRRA